jgi:hypothetical protein
MPSIKSRTGLIFLLIFISLFPAVNSAAQVYYPFPDSNAIWNIAARCNESSTRWEIRFGLQGDTIIDQKTYSKVYRLADTTLSNPNSIYFGAIREDSLKKVYMHLSATDSLPGIGDFLVYDFTRQPGDTIWYPVTIGYSSHCDLYQQFYFMADLHYEVVESVDSILINNGYRKQWHLKQDPDHQYHILDSSWVEGIGGIKWFGLISPIMGYFYGIDYFKFACFKQNDTVLYMDNMNCSHCFCLNTILASPRQDPETSGCLLSFLPGPILRVELSQGSGPVTVDIFDFTGRILNRSLVSASTTEIPLNAVSPGLYIAVARNHDGTVVGKLKFVVSESTR